eukprot:TRINITY_DN18390_c0_g1_i1.p1 TRINITY_DN18390_c0_g1~~TRINITY_DN18390_c0_g1_i1.p1  ORF type:complete len:325 (-),score=27.74 TRINITY_DN18390_c0_g1_i1:85-1059(-)
MSASKKRKASERGSTSTAKRPKTVAPTSVYSKPLNLRSLVSEADRVGFNAKAYISKGYTIMRKPALSERELSEALAAALRVRSNSKASDNEGEFVFLRDQSSPDKLQLFALLNAYVPLLHQLFGGIKLPGSNMAPYAHHNQVQVAIKKPGFEGYDKIEKMHAKGALSGHVDQPAAKQSPPGQTARNYSALLGICLSGDTHRRDDAGNLFVAPGSHNMLAEQFRKFDGPIPWHLDIAEKYLNGKKPPRMEAVRAGVGQAVLMHHQTIHAVAPNHSDKARVMIYFRITAQHRPDGNLLSYPAAMRDTLKETPRLRELAAHQKNKAG